jgi:hypothetical protein
MSSDTPYYRQRAVTERALALKSDQVEVREIHLELARLYDALIEQEGLRLPSRSASVPQAGQRSSAPMSTLKSALQDHVRG